MFVTLLGTGGSITFKYDPFGQRIQKSGPAGTTNDLYDGANVVTDLNASGAVVASYAQSAGIDEPLASNSAAGTAFFEADGLGSVTSLSGMAGITDAYTYDALGVTTANGANPNRYRYTGREWDSETGLYYYRARYYDLQTGRFISEDPIAFLAGNNFYAYVLSNPTTWNDPSGKNPGVIALPWLGAGEGVIGVMMLRVRRLRNGDRRRRWSCRRGGDRLLDLPLFQGQARWRISGYHAR